MTAGNNPSSALSGTTKVSAVTKNAYVRVNLTAKTGSGAVNFQLRGASGIVSQANPSGAGAGGTCGALGGDVTGTCAANTVVKINNAAVPTSATALGSNASQQLIARTVSSVNGSLKLASFNGTAPVNGDCAVWLNGNVQDFGGACAPVLSVYGAVGSITALAPTGVMTFDASGMTSADGMKVPVIAGAAPSGNGAIAYNTTLNELHAAQSGADALIPQSTANPANDDCAKWVVVGGQRKLGSTGTACGSAAGISGSGTAGNPTAWTSSTVVGDATAHNESNIMKCVSASASGTTYTCATSPTFTPAANDTLWFKADVANTASATLNVNAAGAKTIKKQGGGTNLAANDLLIGTWTPLTYDGTNWQMQGQIGNASAATQSNFSGVVGSLPAFGTAGNTYIATDVPYTFFDTGAAWRVFYQNYVVTPPAPCSNWTYVNQAGQTSTCTGTGSNSPMSITYTNGAGCCNNTLLVKTAPSTPYTFVMRFSNTALYPGSGSYTFNCGIGLRDSVSGKLVTFVFYNNAIQVNKWNSLTSDAGASAFNQINAPLNSVTFKITNDGTNRKYYFSNGQTLVLVYSEASGTFMTENQVGIAVLAWSGTSAVVDVWDWTQS